MLVDTLAALVAGDDSASAGTTGLVVRSGYGRLSGPLPCPPALRQRVAARQVGLSEDARLGLAFVGVTGHLDELSAATKVALPTVHELERHELVVSLVHRGRPVLVPSAGAIRRVVLAELGPIGVRRVAGQLLERAPQGLLLDRELWAALASVDGASTPTIATIRQLIGDQRRDEVESLARLAAERGDGVASVALAELLAECGDRAGAGALLDGDELDLPVMVQATAELVQILLWNLDQTERAVALARSASDATGGVAGPAVPILLAVLAHAGRIGPAAELFEAMAGSDVRANPLVGAVARPGPGRTGAPCARTPAIRGRRLRRSHPVRPRTRPSRWRTRPAPPTRRFGAQTQESCTPRRS